MYQILLVEDEFELAGHLTTFLEKEGFIVTHVLGQTDAINSFSENVFHCILLDISLREGNGFSTCSIIREKSNVPVIFLTASGDETCTVAGLEMGADDYISKPFRPRELVARIKSVIRRKSDFSSLLVCKNITLDTAKGVVTKNDAEIFLSALEYRLLLVFLTNQGQLFSRDRLIEELWSASGEFVNDNTLTVYIKRLREKIEDDFQKPQIIKTIRGLGYKAGI